MKKQKLRNILAIGILTASSVFSGCESQKGTFVGALTNAEIGQLLAGRDTESTSTDTGISVGVAYFWGSELNKGRKLKIDRVYTRLMKLNDRERIKQEIDFFADYEFGNPKNDWTTPNERDRAYEALEKRWYFEEYKQGLEDRPLIQVLNDYRGFLFKF